jgi:hypothetical protein
LKPTPPGIDEQTVEYRGKDRRRYSLRTVYGSLFINRRRNIRRQDELFFTLLLINNGAMEMNILMDWLIKKDIQTFAAVKMAVTSLALLVLVMHFNFRIYRIFAVRHLMYALVPMYMALIAHEINMLQQII